MTQGRPGLYVRAAARSVMGARRYHNQDGVLLVPLGGKAVRISNAGATKSFAGAWPTAPGVALAVIDGMGAGSTGDVATDEVINALSAHFEGAAPGDRDARQGWVGSALEEAHQRLRLPPRPSRDDLSLGAAVVTAVAFGAELYLAHAGDSRAYRWRDGELEALTRDDTVANGCLDAGVSEAEVTTGLKKVLTKALGAPASLNPSLRALDVRAGDMIFMCSGGLHGAVDDGAIARMLRSHESPGEACSKLVALAERAGEYDDLTALIAAVRARDESGPPVPA